MNPTTQPFNGSFNGFTPPFGFNSQFGFNSPYNTIPTTTPFGFGQLPLHNAIGGFHPTPWSNWSTPSFNTTPGFNGFQNVGGVQFPVNTPQNINWFNQFQTPVNTFGQFNQPWGAQPFGGWNTPIGYNAPANTPINTNWFNQLHMPVNTFGQFNQPQPFGFATPFNSFGGFGFPTPGMTPGMTPGFTPGLNTNFNPNSNTIDRDSAGNIINGGMNHHGQVAHREAA